MCGFIEAVPRNMRLVLEDAIAIWPGLDMYDYIFLSAARIHDHNDYKDLMRLADLYCEQCEVCAAAQ